MNIEELKAEETLLRRQLKENLFKQREINLAEWKEKYNISIGDVVEFLDGKELKRGIIDNIQYNMAEVSSFQRVRLFKKDGKPGDRVVNVFTKMTKANDQTTGNK